MELLIDFIFNNLFFVVIILFTLFSMLKRAGGAGQSQEQGQGQGKQPQGGMPPFGDGPGGGAGRTRQRPAQAAKPAPTPAKQSPIRAAETPRPSLFAGNGVGSGEGGYEAGSAYGDSVLSVVSPEQEDHRADSAESADVPVLSAEKAREGFIWSEVFGPPRARRPYRGGGGGWR